METMNEQQAMNGAEMPRYRCHKEVHALKINAIKSDEYPKFQGPICRGSYSLGTACGSCERCAHERQNGPIRLGATITPEEPGYAPFRVSAEFMRKHNPQPGGYFVVYKDGYQSFSPAEAFEDGYTRIEA